MRTRISIRIWIWIRIGIRLMIDFFLIFLVGAGHITYNMAI